MDTTKEWLNIEIVTCLICDGVGKMWRSGPTCHSCKGDGKIERDLDTNQLRLLEKHRIKKEDDDEQSKCG